VPQVVCQTVACSDFGLALAARSAFAAVAHRVDLNPFGVCVRQPSTVAVAFEGQYRATSQH